LLVARAFLADSKYDQARVELEVTIVLENTFDLKTFLE